MYSDICAACMNIWGERERAHATLAGLHCKTRVYIVHVCLCVAIDEGTRALRFQICTRAKMFCTTKDSHRVTQR